MLPDKDTISVFGGSRDDRIPVTNARTDVGAAHFNPLINDTAMLSVLAPRVWCAFHYTGAAMVIDANDEMWNGVNGYVAPVAARTSSGIYTLTYPATVNDFIPTTDKGGSSTPHNVNLRFAIGHVRPGGVASSFTVECSASANVITVNLKTAGTVGDVNNLVLDVIGF